MQFISELHSNLEQSPNKLIHDNMKIRGKFSHGFVKHAVQFHQIYNYKMTHEHDERIIRLFFSKKKTIGCQGKSELRPTFAESVITTAAPVPQ